MRFTIYIFLIFGLINAAFAQSVKFYHYTTESGLSQGTVKAILQDNRGFMWFGTDDGLNKFDGYNFFIYQNNANDSNTISNNDINALIQDRDGIIWIGTNWGLNAYNPWNHSFTQFLQSPKKEAQLSDNVIQTLYEGSLGVIWIGTENGGLVGYDKSSGKFTVYKNDPNETSSVQSNNITYITESDDGNLWIGTNKGLAKFKKLSGLFVRYPFRETTDTTWNANNNKITCIIEDSQGRLWVGTDKGGVNLFDRNTGKFTGYGIQNPASQLDSKKNRIRSIKEDSDGKIWVATSGGLTFFDEEKNCFASYFQNEEKDPFSLNFNDLYSLYLDHAGSVWIGTYGNGINVFHPKRTKFQHYRKNESATSGFKSNLIHGINEDKNGMLLIATNGGGLTGYDRKNNYIINYQDIFPEIHSSILCVNVDSDGIIWLGTWGKGLQKFDRNNKKVTTYDKESGFLANNTVLCIYEEDGILWIGTYSGGLTKFDKKTEKAEIFNTSCGLGSDKIFTIIGNHTDTLWIGTRYGGFNIFNKKTGKAYAYLVDKKSHNSISSNTVIHAYDNQKGVIWLATESGLDKFYKKSQAFENYFRKDGLPNDHIYAILPDYDNNLWLSTNKGISRFDTKLEPVTPMSFRNFDVNDGLQSNEFNQCSYFKSKSGEMFFGGTNGFNSFMPSQMNENKYLPPVYITSFKLFNNDYPLDTAIMFKKEIELTYKENFLSFEFVGLDFVFPSKNQYSFMMENLDNDWSTPSDRRYASYPNMPPGKYIFRVKAANNDGFWNEDGASIIIIIKPPFWKTIPFMIFAILFGLIVIIVIYKIRVQSIKAEKKLLEDHVSERTQELTRKNNDITSSIKYAKRIQEAILPSHETLQKFFRDSFIYFKPKDIVSGDFFWTANVNDTQIIAVADCTGHGVPGAFMSIIGNTFLKDIVNENQITQPDQILKELDNNITSSLRHDPLQTEIIDGMDIAICCIKEYLLEFSGANRPLFIIANNTLSVLRGNKMSVGGKDMNIDKKFETVRFKLQKGDCLYMFSDGLTDQFGGDEGKKFLQKNFKELLLRVWKLPMEEQKEEINKSLQEWMQGHEQVDDILLIGIRV